MKIYKVKFIPGEIEFKQELIHLTQPWFPLADTLEISIYDDNNQLEIYSFNVFNFVYMKIKEFIPNDFLTLFKKEYEKFGRGVGDQFVVEYLDYKFRLASISYTAM